MILIILVVGLPASAAPPTIETVCGPMLAVDVVSGDEVHALFDACEAEVFPSRGAYNIEFLDGNPALAASEPLSDLELAGRTSMDLAMVEKLGFAPDQFGHVVTRQVGAARAGSEGTWVEYLSSKTFIDREVDGATVQGSRVVVTRDQAGVAARVHAVWPSLEQDTIILDLTVRGNPEEALSQLGIDAEDVALVREVLHPLAVADGRVERAVRVTEVHYYVRGDTSGRITGVYLTEDGSLSLPELEDL